VIKNMLAFPKKTEWDITKYSDLVDHPEIIRFLEHPNNRNDESP
jgi:hypothetical protein